MFIRSRRNQRDVLIRERYNVVQYGTDANAQTFVEGLPEPEVRQAADGTVGSKYEQVYDEVRIYDYPPFTTRFGQVS